jgi:hypothetical protein
VPSALFSQLSEPTVNANEDVLISPLLSPSKSSSPKAVLGASKAYFNPLSSIVSSKLPLPLLHLANTPLSSL